jgi:hypothetical protein
MTLSPQPKYQIKFEPDESTVNNDSIMKCEFLPLIEIEIFEIRENAKR